MRWVSRASVVLLMTRVTKRAVQRVVVVDVAIRTQARWNGVRTGQLESGSRMVECAVGPLHRVVARLASCRESRCYVIYR